MSARTETQITSDLMSNHSFGPEAAAKRERRVEPKPLTIVSGYQILRGNYPPPVFLFENLIHNGVTILAGRPKVGKSWLALQIAIGAALGQPALGRFYCPKPHGVLYFALEESEGRTHNWQKRFITAGAPNAIFTDNIGMVYDLEPLSRGGVEQIDAALSAKQYGLVIIDTFLRAQGGIRKPKNGDPLQEDYESIKPLQQLAQKHKTAILLIHHSRKMGAEYALDQIAGTTGLTASSDSNWTLNRTAQGVTLTIQGRDMADAEWSLRFEQDDPLTFGWSVAGTADEARTSGERRAVLDVLRENGGLMKPAEIATALGRNRATVRGLLARMRSDALICSENGDYRLPK